MESMRPIFKSEMSIYQSKANLCVKILFGKLTHHLDPKIRQILIRGMFGNEDPTVKFYFWS